MSVALDPADPTWIGPWFVHGHGLGDERRYYVTAVIRQPFKHTIHGEIIPLEQSQGPDPSRTQVAYPETTGRVARISQMGTVDLAMRPEDVLPPQSGI